MAPSSLDGSFVGALSPSSVTPIATMDSRTSLVAVSITRPIIQHRATFQYAISNLSVSPTDTDPDVSLYIDLLALDVPRRVARGIIADVHIPTNFVHSEPL